MNCPEERIYDRNITEETLTDEFKPRNDAIVNLQKIESFEINSITLKS